MSATTILLYGRTNSGKSSQVGVLAEHVYKTTGKKTRLYTSDKGGIDPVAPYVTNGYYPYPTLDIIEPVEIGETSPWVFLNKSVRGYIRDTTGKWVLDAARNEQVGLYVFESMNSIAELLKLDMEQKAAQGVNIGGGGNIAFAVSGDGESFKIGGANMAMYGVAQSRIKEEVWQSQRLSAQYVLWTAGASKDDDGISTTKVIGPDVIGKALTGEVPRWFNYTFRIDVIAAQGGKPERHLLYLGSHSDVGAGNAPGLGNIRRPLDAPTIKETIIEPADLVKALHMVRDESAKAAVDVIKKRLEAHAKGGS